MLSHGILQTLLVVIAHLSTSQCSPLVTLPNGVTYHGPDEGPFLESFLNIPFGHDTGGANRFAPPRMFVQPPNAIVNASAPGPVCPQPKAPVPALPIWSNVTVRQVTQGVGHGCHESIDDANYDGDLATYMRK
jgi:hypothetical protein